MRGPKNAREMMELARTGRFTPEPPSMTIDAAIRVLSPGHRAHFDERARAGAVLAKAAPAVILRTRGGLQAAIAVLQDGDLTDFVKGRVAQVIQSARLDAESVATLLRTLTPQGLHRSELLVRALRDRLSQAASVESLRGTVLAHAESLMLEGAGRAPADAVRRLAADILVSAMPAMPRTDQARLVALLIERTAESYTVSLLKGLSAIGAVFDVPGAGDRLVSATRATKDHGMLVNLLPNVPRTVEGNAWAHSLLEPYRDQPALFAPLLETALQMGLAPYSDTDLVDLCQDTDARVRVVAIQASAVAVAPETRPQPPTHSL